VAAARNAPPSADVIDSLDALVEAIHAARFGLDHAVERADYIRDLRATGLRYRDIVASEERPLIVEAIRDSLLMLVDAASRFQRAEAAALRSDGLTLARIGAFFGLSRQRVAELLRPRPDAQVGKTTASKSGAPRADGADGAMHS
jgi:hypothetical protein